MRRRNLALFSLLACGAVVTLVACGGGSEKSGACTGIEDGTYFQLQQYNYDTTAPLEVRVNGRFVGNVAAGSTNSSTGNIEPGETLLGEFPICSTGVIDARGTGLTTTRVCATSVLTSQKCRAERQDYCWEIVLIVPDINNPPPG